MMNFLKSILTWWNGATINTRFYTWRKGALVGEDEAGNRFYESRDGKRRWVIFDGEAEASRVTPDWHGWLHHTYAEPPTKAPLAKKSWEKSHQENLTGTLAAYSPSGSLRQSSPADRSDYEAWQPE